MQKRKIVLDTNCLIASLSRSGQYYPVWKGLQTGKYILCVSTDILEEYAEIITEKMSVNVATNVIHLLLESEFVELVNPYFSLHLIEADLMSRVVRKRSISATEVKKVSAFPN